MSHKPGPFSGRTHSKESKQKTSLALKGRHLGPKSEEHKEKIRQALKGRLFPHMGGNKGKVMSEEQKRKISESMKGTVFSEERNRKISQAHMGRQFTPQHKENMSKARIKAMQEGRVHHTYRGICGKFFSQKNQKEINYRSGLEKAWYEKFERCEDIVWYKVEWISIPYLFNGLLKHYLVDLFVLYSNGLRELIEIKPEGSRFRENPETLAKWNSAKEWCAVRKQRPITFRVLGYEELNDVK